MEVFFESIQGLINDSGFINLDWKSLVMIGISCVLVYLAVVKQFEPLLLLPIAFGMLLTNIPCPAEFQIFHMDFFVGKEIDFGKVLHEGGLLDILYLGVKLGVYPPLIFLGIGTMTDF